MSKDQALRQVANGQPSSALSALSPQEAERYQRLVELIGGDYVFYTHDPDGVLTYVSPSGEKILGHSVETVLGMNWREFIGEGFVGREMADRVEGEVSNGKQFYCFQVEVAHLDGSKRLFEIQQRPHFDASGTYVSMEGIAKDVTESHQRAEELRLLKESLEEKVLEQTAALRKKNELLRESALRYKNVVEDQTELLVRWLPAGEITFANGACCWFLGAEWDQVQGTSLLDYVHHDQIVAFRECVASLSPASPHGRIECRVVRRNGTATWIEWTTHALYDENNVLREYQSVGRDVTNLKRADDKLRQREAHMAHVSRLAVMGELVSGMAHEIHQPLHAAKTFAEAARRNLELGTEQNIATALDCAKEISNAISRTASIIRRLREFTQPRSLMFEQLSLNDVVQGALELVSYESRRANVTIHCELGEQLPLVQGDKVQLEQACVHLLINAFEALAKCPSAKRHVHLRTEPVSDAVRLAIQDDGCGINEEDIEKLFDAFYTTKPQGVGMGLSLCRSIAETHGGKIWAQANAESGMTFVLEIPRLMRPGRWQAMNV